MAGARTRQLVRLLMVLTVVTGVVDAVSYLVLGRVFVANMTGNVVFLGFAWAGDQALSAVASLVALLAFLLGAVVGGRLASRRGAHRGRHLAAASIWGFALLGAAVIVAVTSRTPYPAVDRYALIVLLALAMGLQNATARALGVPDATTTVLTLTLTGLAADSRLATGTNPRLIRRVTAVAAMLGGALFGALLALHADPAWALAAAAGLLLVVAASAAGLAHRSAATEWTTSG